ncbi:MAG: PQQ-dependent sugar dehydrogenase [Chloroflexi bacterium]|nr:PQQ-dependent sugar dehydrogenase [Chloroflexota bacterium]
MKIERRIWILLFTLLLFSCQNNQVETQTSFTARLFGEKTPEVELIGPTAAPVTAIQLTPIAAGLSKPVYLTHAGDDRFFAAEQAGTIRIIRDGELLPEPFLDVSEILATDGSERGLLGLAFHPQYAQNGYFYIVYTNVDGNTEISRYTVSTDDPNQADLDSATLILFIEQPYGNHNGGQLAFGPDGLFYIGLGDGGAVSDPYDNAQDPGTLLGAILRLDVDTAVPYAIPKDNPFVGQRGKLGEVWAIGLRNPWAFSFDRETGDMYIADVGQEGPEELNFQPANTPVGVNFGWPFREGSACYEADTCTSRGLRPPIYEYPHGEDGCAVIGGYVYRGQQFPELAGNYFFSDFCSGRIWTLRYGEDGWQRTAVANTDTQISTIAEGVDGELYALFYRTGEVFKIEPTE